MTPDGRPINPQSTAAACCWLRCSCADKREGAGLADSDWADGTLALGTERHRYRTRRHSSHRRERDKNVALRLVPDGQKGSKATEVLPEED
ncbi:hypothetical protein CDD83_9572 [Cordyceps sp. RAO-2017]|nr:hypothetical protein CDD83_9572 [Cordyceps sp. RAO-2017]